MRDDYGEGSTGTKETLRRFLKVLHFCRSFGKAYSFVGQCKQIQQLSSSPEKKPCRHVFLGANREVVYPFRTITNERKRIIFFVQIICLFDNVVDVETAVLE